MFIYYTSLLDTDEEKSKFETIYLEYRKLMYHNAHAILQDRALAEDAVHEAFLRIIKNLQKIKEPISAQTASYVVIICRNIAKDMRKKEMRTIPFEDMEAVGPVSDADDVLEKANFGSLVAQIKQLPEIYRDVILLRYADGYSVKEIAKMLDKPYETIKARIARGKQMLAKQMEETVTNG